MASNRTFEERLAELEKRESELKKQKKDLKARHAKEERKKRTHNLIEIGGAVYSVLGREFVEGDVDRLISFLKGQDKRGGYFSRAMNDFPPEPAPTVAPATDSDETKKDSD